MTKWDLRPKEVAHLKVTFVTGDRCTEGDLGQDIFGPFPVFVAIFKVKPSPWVRLSPWVKLNFDVTADRTERSRIRISNPYARSVVGPYPKVYKQAKLGQNKNLAKNQVRVIWVTHR